MTNLDETSRMPAPNSETATFEDDNWEDINAERPSPSDSVRSLQSTSTSRRRRPARVVPQTTASMVQTGASYYHPRELRTDFDIDLPPESIRSQDEWRHIKPHIRSIFGYFVRVVVDAFWIHRPLFSIALALIMAYLVFTSIFSITRSVASPMCSIPVLHKALPFCWREDLFGGREAKTAKWADYPRLMDIQSSSFEQLLDDSIGSSVLALEVKKAEMATSDLATLVRVSDLRSRDSLAQTLVNFVDDAKKTSRGLQTLSAKINGAVDTVLAVNDYALNTIEVASAQKSLISRALAPLSLSMRGSTKEIITEAFAASMNSLSIAMERCILEAQVSLSNLDRLEESLSLIHEMVAREDLAIELEKSEVLSHLWTLLGGNKGKLRGMDNHLALLKGVAGYRKRALAHVVGALQTLGALGADMEELRSRVAAPDIVGDKIPVEVHIKSIRGGLERLKIGQTRSKERQEETVMRILGS